MLKKKIIAGVLAGIFVSSAFADALTDRARRLLEQRQPKEAYQLLLPQEGARAGDPEFDYLFGIAALDSGEGERAVFALERVLAVQPNNHLARAEIARAYMVLGERESAKREFQAVRAQQIPDDAKASIDKYLSAIAASEQTQVTGFVEAGAGHDTNVNSATGLSQIALPALGGIVATLNSGATRRSDTFTSLAGGLNVTHRLTPEWALVGGAAAAAKLNSSEKQFDTLTLDANAGARWSRGKEAVTLGAQLQSFELDYARYRETRGLIAQWQHSYDEARQATVFGQFSELRYPTQSIRNADRQVLGVAYAQAFNAAYSPVLFLSGYGGREKELSAGVPHLGHDLWGARVGGQVRFGDGWGGFANASYEERPYGGPEPIFLVTRKDKQSDLSVGVTYLLRANTTVIGQISHTDNRSNVDLNQFKRTLASISLRVTF